jgi:hypothetical protein
VDIPSIPKERAAAIPTPVERGIRNFKRNRGKFNDPQDQIGEPA